MRTGLALVAALGMVVSTACSSGDDDDGAGSEATADDISAAVEDAIAADVVFPDEDWDRAADAAELGFDQAILDDLAAQAEQAGSNCLLVTRHGRVAAEWYWNDTDAASSQEVFSASKSVASTLVGIAQAEGALDIADPASDYVDAWVGTSSEGVTIENLLSNDSGREWSFAIDYGQLPVEPDLDAFATGLGQQFEPGEAWAYNNAAIQTLDVVMREATGEHTADYGAEHLFGPVGMDDTSMSVDGVGNTKMFMGVQSTCEDMARFGYLFLREGSWDGTEVVPSEWVDAATGAPSQELNAAYGYLWWLNRSGPILSPVQATDPGADAPDRPDSQLVPGAPEEMFFALGLGNQIVAVDPSSETVVVRLGGSSSPEGSTPFDTAAAARVVTDALVDPDA